MDYFQAAQDVRRDASSLWLFKRFGCVDLGECIAIFSNMGNADNGRGRAVVSLFRQFLKEAGVAELAFATSRDGYSWAMVLDTPAAAANFWVDKAIEAWSITCPPFRLPGGQ